MRRWIASATGAVCLTTLLWAQAATAATNHDGDGGTQIENVEQDSDGNVQVETNIEHSGEPYEAEEIADQIIESDHTPGCTDPNGCRVQVFNEQGEIIHSQHVMCQYNCNSGGGGYTPQQTPTTPPPIPSAPTLATPSVALSCTQSGWQAEWNEWASTSTVEYDAEWEAQWRAGSDPAGLWRPETPTISGTAAVVSGGPEPGETIEVQVRGRAQRRHGNAIGWSGWSPPSAWTSWRTVTDTCPTRPFPTPTVSACRSAGGVEVTWTVPPGLSWRVGTGWVLWTDEVNAVGNLIGNMSSLRVFVGFGLLGSV
ncbi:hypothetical protein [Candidatus Poriferisodalis sp.]|uniref:hypothetical protein n=1 Tax=Candidatus Poriferisodalis sp. TaxID=3101277 RepID=UPI003B02A408